MTNSTYRWEKRKRNLWRIFYYLLTVLGIIIVFPASLIIVKVIVAPILILFLLKIISKKQLSKIFNFFAIITRLLFELILFIFPIREPVRKAWKFLRKIFRGEDVMVNGLVLVIHECDKYTYQLSNESSIVSYGDYILNKCCIVKMQDLTLSPKPIYIEIDVPLKELRNNLNLTVFSKCIIKCKRWKDYFRFEEIINIKQHQTLQYEKFEMVS